MAAGCAKEDILKLHVWEKKEAEVKQSLKMTFYICAQVRTEGKKGHFIHPTAFMEPWA